MSATRKTVADEAHERLSNIFCMAAMGRPNQAGPGDAVASAVAEVIQERDDLKKHNEWLRRVLKENCEYVRIPSVGDV